MKYKYLKVQKGKVTHRLATRGITIINGSIGLQVLESGRLRSKTLETARATIQKIIKKYGKVYVRVVTNIPITKKPEEMRMGQGKGPVLTYIARIHTLNILFEIPKNVPTFIGVKALTAASKIIPFKSKIVYNTPIKN